MIETLYGMRIVVSPLVRDRPKFQLSQQLRNIIGYGQPRYLEQFDAWSARFFGVDYVFLKSKIMDGPGEALICSSAGYFELRRRFPQEKTWQHKST
jgi:hypothetical protein